MEDLKEEIKKVNEKLENEKSEKEQKKGAFVVSFRISQSEHDKLKEVFPSVSLHYACKELIKNILNI